MVTQATKIKAKVVNGINVDDLLRLIDGVRQNAAKGQTNWRVTTTWQGQTRSRANVDGFAIGGQRISRQFSFDVDEPLELGGSNRFANPQEYLIAALNACMVVGYAAQCAVRGITIESLAVETEGEIDLRGFLGLDPAVAAGYEDLRSVVRIKGSGTKEQFAEVTLRSSRRRQTTISLGPLRSNRNCSSSDGARCKSRRIGLLRDSMHRGAAGRQRSPANDPTLV